MLLGRASFALNLEWKALKITLKTVSLPDRKQGGCIPLFKENSEEREKT